MHSLSHHLLIRLLPGFISPEQSIALTKFTFTLAVFAYMPNYTRIPFLEMHTELVET